MANAEMQLISRIIYTGDMASVLSWGISDNDFRTNEAKSIWRYCEGYYQSKNSIGAVIGPKVFENVWPQIELLADNGMTTEALCYEVRRARIIAEAKEAVMAMVDNVELDPTQAIAIIHTQMQNLLAIGEAKNHDLSFGDAMEKLVTRYQTVRDNQYAYAKMSYPWQILNEKACGGVQEDDYIVIYGRPKMMKTWVLTCFIAEAFQKEMTALVYTKEMTQENIIQRVVSVIGKFPYQELRNGKLSREDEILLMEMVKYARDTYRKANIITLDGRMVGAGGDTVAWLQSKVEHYKPDIVFIDGMYLLSDSTGNKKTADWQRVTNISRAIRNMILHTRIPVVATMQANRGAAKHAEGNLDEIAYADAVGQDATVAMRTMYNKKEGLINLILAGSREFSLDGLQIGGKPSTDFSFKKVLTEADIEKVEKDAQRSEEAKAKERARKPRTRADATCVEDSNDKDVQRQLGTI
jgi:replicative DNA helicase